jgi:uncharacterized protein YkwD
MTTNSRLSLPSALTRVIAAIGLVAIVTIVWAPPAEAATASELESCFLSQINSARAGAGAGTLTRDGTLSSYGRSHSTRMADSGGLYHSSSGTLESYLPGDWLAWGENVGMTSDSSGCGPLFQAFMDSPGHRANLLNASFDIVGIGVIIDDAGYMWTTHVFVDVAGGGSTTTTTTTTSTTTTSTSTTTTTTTSAPRSTTTTAPPVTTTTTAPPVTTTAATTTTSGPGSTTTAGSSTTTTQASRETTAQPTTTTGADSTTTPSAAPIGAAPPSAIEAIDESVTTTAPPDLGDEDEPGEPLTATLAPVAAGNCSGPFCNDLVALLGLLGLAGVLGGVLAYWALRY